MWMRLRKRSDRLKAPNSQARGIRERRNRAQRLTPICKSNCACFCYAKSVVNMTWLFFVLILSTMAVVCVGCAIYLRVRRHMKASAGDSHHMETGHPAGESR